MANALGKGIDFQYGDPPYGDQLDKLDGRQELVWQVQDADTPDQLRVFLMMATPMPSDDAQEFNRHLLAVTDQLVEAGDHMGIPVSEILMRQQGGGSHDEVKVRGARDQQEVYLAVSDAATRLGNYSRDIDVSVVARGLVDDNGQDWHAYFEAQFAQLLTSLAHIREAAQGPQVHIAFEHGKWDPFPGYEDVLQRVRDELMRYQADPALQLKGTLRSLGAILRERQRLWRI